MSEKKYKILEIEKYDELVDNSRKELVNGTLGISILAITSLIFFATAFAKNQPIYYAIGSLYGLGGVSSVIDYPEQVKDYLNAIRDRKEYINERKHRQ